MRESGHTLAFASEGLKDFGRESDRETEAWESSQPWCHSTAPIWNCYRRGVVLQARPPSQDRHPDMDGNARNDAAAADDDDDDDDAHAHELLLMMIYF